MEKLIEFEGEPDENSRAATVEDWDAEFGLTPKAEKEHFEFVKKLMKERGMPLPEWTPRKSG